VLARQKQQAGVPVVAPPDGDDVVNVETSNEIF
jgi:hypothetical protein